MECRLMLQANCFLWSHNETMLHLVLTTPGIRVTFHQAQEFGSTVRKNSAKPIPAGEATVLTSSPNFLLTCHKMGKEKRKNGAEA